MTRAMRQLYLTCAEQRRLHGVDSYGAASRFIREVPEDLLEEVRPRVQVSRPVAVGALPAAAGTGRRPACAWARGCATASSARG